jgi:hypothetical protein
LVWTWPSTNPGGGHVNISGHTLTPDEADAMADALCAHAHYARKQGDAIKEPEVCGRILDVAGWFKFYGEAPTCQRPEGHPVGGCRSYRMAADG